MDTFCPKCKRTMHIDEYESRDMCPGCGYDLNLTHYRAALVLAIVFGAGPLLFASQLPADQRGLLWAVSAAMFTIAVGTVVGDRVLRARGMHKKPRRSVVGWGSTLCGMLIGVAVALIAAP